MRKLLLVFLACIGLTGVSAAAPIFEFIGTPGIGTVSYDGSTGSLRTCGGLNTTTGGQSSGFGAIAFFGAGGSLSIVGSLDADSGAPLLGTGPIILSGATDSSTGGQSSGVGPIAFFGAGGSSSIVGSLDADNGAPLLGTGPIILSGATDSSFLIAETGLVEIGWTRNNIKSPGFLAFFGNTNRNFTFDYAEYATPPVGYAENTDPGLPPTPLAGPPTLSGYTYNFSAPIPVAEPSALLLLGTGLLVGAGLLGRKSLG